MPRFVAQVPVRWTDQDAYRHVNNAKAVTLLEEARVAMIFDAAAAEGVAGFAAGLLVVGLHVDYRRQIPYRSDGVRVTMAIEEVRAASFRITYEMHDGPERGRRRRRAGVDPDGDLRPRRRTAAPADRRGAGLPRPLDRRMSALHITDPDDRGDLGTFVGRVVRLDQTAAVRLLGSASGRVTAWASTPFDVLATRSVPGTLEPADVTTFAATLLSALSVDRADTVDPGSGGLWQGLLPPADGWAVVDTVPAAELEGLTERGLVLAREHAGPLGPPASLLDQTVLTVTGAAGPPVRIPMRCLFALSGMGFVGAGDAGETVRVSATSSWLRLDARYGAVVRRRITALPLLT